MTSTAIVTGASSGFGRAIALALAGTGEQVIGVAPDRGQLSQLPGTITPVPADAADPGVAARLIAEHQPRLIVLAAGAAPLTEPIHQQTWPTFSRNWEMDVQQTFNWTREALLRPLAPGSVVIAFSSGAALRGSPVSGGYAGAKATIRFIMSYAAQESERAGLGIRFISVLPQLTPATTLGAAAVAAYAAREGADLADFTARLGPPLTPEQTATAVLELIRDGQGAYLLTAAGLSELE
jgi:NAD(P)-dependent dehydrogenase (short-subunit alcohol dehydrogenase family)